MGLCDVTIAQWTDANNNAEQWRSFDHFIRVLHLVRAIEKANVYFWS